MISSHRVRFIIFLVLLEHNGMSKFDESSQRFLIYSGGNDTQKFFNWWWIFYRVNHEKWTDLKRKLFFALCPLYRVAFSLSSPLFLAVKILKFCILLLNVQVTAQNVFVFYNFFFPVLCLHKDCFFFKLEHHISWVKYCSVNFPVILMWRMV